MRINKETTQSTIHTLLQIRPEQFFLIFYCIVASALLVALPPGQAQDEDAHFYKAYQISKGNIRNDNHGTTSGGHIPKALVDFIESTNKSALIADNNIKYRPSSNMANLKVDSSTTVYVPFSNLSTYSPISYAPQALGIGVASIFTDSAATLFYVARAAGGIFYGAILYFAIRLIPRRMKWALIGVALLPMSVYLSVAVSADTMVLALTAILVALLAKCYTTAVVTRSDAAMLVAVTPALALSKQTYIVFVPLLLVLFFRRKAMKKPSRIRATRSLAVAVILSGVLFGLWYLLNRSTSTDVQYMQLPSGLVTDPSGQAQAMLSDPLRFISAVVRSFLTIDSNGVIVSYFGAFGWLSVVPPYWTYFVLAISATLLFGHRSSSGQKEQPDSTFTRGPSMVILGVAIINIIMICVALYLFWTPVGSSSVSGIQGRYLLPITLVLIPVLANRYAHSVRLRYALGGYVVAWTAIVTTIISRFY